MAEKVFSRVKTPTDSYEILITAFIEQANLFLNSDPQMSNLWRAVIETSGEEPDFDSLIYDFALARGVNTDERRLGGINPSEAAGIFRSTLQADFLANEPEFLANDGSHEQFKGFIKRLLGDELRLETFETNFLTRRVQTTHFRRAALMDLYLQARNYAAGNKLRVLVIGAGTLLLEKQILYKHYPEFAYEPVHLSPDRDSEILEDKINNDLLRRPADEYIDFILATDLLDPLDPVTRSWAMACYRLGELTSRRFMDRIRRYNAIDPPNNLRYGSANLTYPQGIEEFRAEYGTEPYDVILFPTVLHQNNYHEASAMMSFADQHTTAEATVAAIDFAYTKGGRMRFFSDWHQNDRYRVLEKGAHSSGRGWHEQNRSRDSRCEELSPWLGQTLVSGNLVPTAEVLLSI